MMTQSVIFLLNKYTNNFSQKVVNNLKNKTVTYKRYI